MNGRLLAIVLVLTCATWACGTVESPEQKPASPKTTQPAAVGTIRIIAAGKANIRAEPKDTGIVLTQVDSGSTLILLSLEGDWFRVQLPTDPRFAGTRRDGYISKKVAAIEAPPTAAVPAPAAAPGPVTKAEAHDTGMSVALTNGNDSISLTLKTATLRSVTAKLDAIDKLAGSIDTAVPPSATGKDLITYIWTIAGASADRVVSGARPSFLVVFNGIPGVGPDDFAPALVRLAPSSTVRVIGATHGRADQLSRVETDWEVMKDFRQDAIHADVSVLGQGAARLQTSKDLPPGEYAIVLRPNDKKKKLSGSAVFHGNGDGRALAAVWDFRIK